jgi:hypothetical protein
MIKLITSLFLFLFFIFNCATISRVDYSRPVSKRIDIVRRIELQKAKKIVDLPVGICTVFAISKHELATAGHCVVPGTSLKLDKFIAVPILVDHERDIARLWIWKHSLPILKIADYSPRPMVDKVTIIGCPFGFCNSRTDGYFAGKYKEFIYLTAPAAPGSSGSPILNEDGEVVGILVAGVPAYPHLTFSVDYLYMKLFLK